MIVSDRKTVLKKTIEMYTSILVMVRYFNSRDKLKSYDNSASIYNYVNEVSSLSLVKFKKIFESLLALDVDHNLNIIHSVKLKDLYFEITNDVNKYENNCHLCQYVKDIGSRSCRKCPMSGFWNKNSGLFCLDSDSLYFEWSINPLDEDSLVNLINAYKNAL